MFPPLCACMLPAPVADPLKSAVHPLGHGKCGRYPVAVKATLIPAVACACHVTSTVPDRAWMQQGGYSATGSASTSAMKECAPAAGSLIATWQVAPVEHSPTLAPVVSSKMAMVFPVPVTLALAGAVSVTAEPACASAAPALNQTGQGIARPHETVTVFDVATTQQGGYSNAPSLST